MKKIVLSIIVGTLVLFVITGCSWSNNSESKKDNETKTNVSSENENSKVITEAPNVKIDYQEINSPINVVDYDREKPLFNGRTPIFTIENVNVGYNKLQDALSKLSEQFSSYDRANMLLQEEAYNNKSKQLDPMSYYRIVYPQLCNTEYYSFYIMDSEYVEGEKNAVETGYVFDVKTGEKVDISHFFPDRQNLAETMREQYKNSQYGNYYNSYVDNYFNRIKSDTTYNFNYYITENNIVVIVDGMSEMAASRNMSNVEIVLPKPSV